MILRIIMLSLLMTGILMTGIIYARSKGNEIYGYAENTNLEGRFDCENSGKPKFGFKSSPLDGVSNFSDSKSCELKTEWGIKSRDFHIQGYVTDNKKLSITYNIDLSDGLVNNNSHRKLFDQKSQFGENYSATYGFVQSGEGQSNHAYVYMGKNNTDWMGDLLLELPDIKISNLVLPGAHDAGMYEVDSDVSVSEICKNFKLPQSLCSFLKNEDAKRILINLAATQKDNTTDQLRLGTRYFDWRPGKMNGESIQRIRHIHGFVPGAKFSDFLMALKNFLSDHKNEVVIVNINDSGFSDDFKLITKNELQQQLSSEFNNSRVLNYQVIDQLDALQQQTLQQLINSKSRAIFIYGKAKVNDSYDDNAYSNSLSNADMIQEKLKQTLNNCGNGYSYNVLQLQDTGSLVISNDWNNYKSEWEAVVASDAGSILHYTKPMFDQQNYNWLIENRNGFKQCNSPVILLNDFVDPALTNHAIGLIRFRMRLK